MLDPCLLTITRALSRQIAREWFHIPVAANDNQQEVGTCPKGR
jgi:hypothetical protein